jgi:four helix bundle protein
MYHPSADHRPCRRYPSCRVLPRRCVRNSGAELAGFCPVAAGSASDLEYHLLLARDLNLLKDYPPLAEQIVEIMRMPYHACPNLIAES